MPSPSSSISVRIGHGRRTVAIRLRTDGRPNTGFSSTVGKVTMRRCCCMFWGSHRPSIPSPRVATPNGLRRTGGNTVTDMNTSTQGRCSRTSFRMSGLIFVEFRTRSCASRGWTISRIAVARRMCNNGTRWTTRSSSMAMVGIHGELPRATAPAPTRSK